MMKIWAKISYKVDADHPDLGDLPEKYWKDKVFTYEDTYTFDSYWEYDDAVEYIKNDLALIAGGGYNAKHIYDVEYEEGVI